MGPCGGLAKPTGGCVKVTWDSKAVIDMGSSGASSDGVRADVVLAGTAISNGAGAVVNGARAVGSSIKSGVSSAAGAVSSGAKAVGGAIAGGASRAWNWLTHH